MDSARGKFWTIEKAQGAVKAAYFSRVPTVPTDIPEVWLRFSEIRSAITDTEGPIGDRTLSRALKGLVSSGKLRRKVEGRATSYSLVTSRADRFRAFARAEASALESAGGIGGRGDSSEGWAVFGLPESVPKTYAHRLRVACRLHREELLSIVDDVSEEALDAVLKPARRKVPRKVFAAGKRAARKVVKYQLLGTYGLAHSARFWRLIEQLAPGSLQSYRKALFPHAGGEISIPDIITAVGAQVSGKKPEDLRPDVEEQLREMAREMERMSKNFQPIWDALTPKQQDRATRRLQAATAMVANLTSVVHA